ncbi:hypothetical protein HNR42_003136 [Deinobacterium chartae]|uniref:Uncharacterized protein n=1 Tax=Deinobacterium chartae TaxID=521158 RepID=A0A841I5F4_9DEIO|nr:hypothetical protein [Deinobacterium chartae]MBB6099678.1 hypothetical protein [Deinobacterium chartae]
MTHLQLALNPTTPSITLESLALTGQPEILLALALNPATPTALAAQLANTTPGIRLALAQTRPEAQLQRNLAKGGVAAWQRLALNPHTPAVLLAELATTSDAATRHAVALHPTTRPDTLNQLAQDDFPDVAQAAHLALSLPPEQRATNLRVLGSLFLEQAALTLTERYLIVRSSSLRIYERHGLEPAHLHGQHLYLPLPQGSLTLTLGSTPAFLSDAFCHAARTPAPLPAARTDPAKFPPEALQTWAETASAAALEALTTRLLSEADTPERNERLHILACLPQPQIQDTIATHPATPDTLLVRLAWEKAFIAWPNAIDTLAARWLGITPGPSLDDPARNALRWALRHSLEADSPVAALPVRLKSNVRHALLGQSSLAPAFLDALAHHTSDPDELVRIAEHPRLGEATRTNLTDRAARNNHTTLLAVLARRTSPPLPPALEVWTALDQRRTPDPHLLEDPLARRAAARHPNVSPELLLAWTTDPDLPLRCILAESTHAQVLTRLSGDPDASVRARVACNAHAPQSVLYTLATELDEKAQLGLAEDPATPTEVLARLASASNASSAVRRRVAQHPTLDGHAATELYRSAVAQQDFDTLRVLARHPALTHENLVALAQIADTEVVLSVARHPHCSPTLLERLATNAPPVRAVVAARASTPNVLTALAQDPSLRVRTALLDNPVLQEPAGHAALERLAADENPSLRDRARVIAATVAAQRSLEVTLEDQRPESGLASPSSEKHPDGSVVSAELKDNTTNQKTREVFQIIPTEIFYDHKNKKMVVKSIVEDEYGEEIILEQTFDLPSELRKALGEHDDKGQEAHQGEVKQADPGGAAIDLGTPVGNQDRDPAGESTGDATAPNRSGTRENPLEAPNNTKTSRTTAAHLPPSTPDPTVTVTRLEAGEDGHSILAVLESAATHELLARCVSTDGLEALRAYPAPDTGPLRLEAGRPLLLLFAHPQAGEAAWTLQVFTLTPAVHVELSPAAVKTDDAATEIAAAHTVDAWPPPGWPTAWPRPENPAHTELLRWALAQSRFSDADLFAEGTRLQLGRVGFKQARNLLEHYNLTHDLQFEYDTTTSPPQYRRITAPADRRNA